MRKYILYFIVLVISVSCSGDAKDHPKKIRIGLVNWIGYTPFYLAEQQGYFARYGLDVELIRIEDVGLRRQAIASGQVDAIALTLDAMIVARDNEIPVQAILALDHSSGGDGILVAEGLVSLHDLKGKNVAYQTGQPSQLFLYEILRKQGLGFDDVQSVFLDADRAGAAFIGGQVDAAVTWEPWLTQAEKQGVGKVYLDSKSTPGLITDVLYARESVVKDKREVFVLLARAWYDAVAYLKENPVEAERVAMSAFAMTEGEVQIIMPKVEFLGKEENRTAFGTTGSPGYLYDSYGTIEEAWLHESVITQPQAATEGIEPGIVLSSVEVQLSESH